MRSLSPRSDARSDHHQRRAGARAPAGELRLRRRQHAEELTQKAPVKMVIPLAACLMPATIIVVLGPAVVKMPALF